MGSGLFPNEDNFAQGCYFRNVTYQGSFRKDYSPPKLLVEVFSDKPDCYLAEYYGYKGESVGYSLQFGGPGGNCGD